ncbi:MAG: hypothetical protein ACPGQV_10160 [Alphaproteobacteria bacterium]
MTSEYIGPDRRGGRKKKEGEPHDPADDVPRIEAPNTLGAKAAGEQIDFVQAQKMVSSAMYEINYQRLRRHSLRIAAIVDKIVLGYQKNYVTPAIQKEVVRLSDISKEISAHLRILTLSTSLIFARLSIR